jgi:hypothetical protein
MSKFISKNEFSKLASVSVSTVDRGIRNHVWPYCQFIKIGSRVLYPASLLAEMEGRAAQNAAQDPIKKSSGENP